MGYFISSLEELLPKKTGKEFFDAHEFLKKKKNQENTMAIKCPKTAISNSLFFFFLLIQKQLPNNTTPNQ